MNARDDLSGRNLERCKQRCRAMPLVVVALTGRGAAIGQLQITLRSLQGLNRRLFVHAERHSLLGRGNVEADNIGGFGRKVRVVALAPGFANNKVDLVVAQEPPHILDVNIAQRLGQQRSGPACKPLRCWLVQLLQYPLVCGLRIDWLLAGPRLVLQPFKAMIGIALSPKAQSGLRAEAHLIAETIGHRLPISHIHFGGGTPTIMAPETFAEPLQTMQSCLDTVAKCIELRPDRLWVFGYVHMPSFKKHQRKIDEHALPQTVERHLQSELIPEALVDAGYVRIGFDHFALPRDNLAAAKREGRLRRNFQGYTDDTPECQSAL
ncbi:hypothetical protein ABIB85_004484 [Bradyrhizobium sp. JR1.5]